MTVLVSGKMSGWCALSAIAPTTCWSNMKGGVTRPPSWSQPMSTVGRSVCTALSRSLQSEGPLWQ
jgi:hypothetical protein